MRSWSSRPPIMLSAGSFSPMSGAFSMRSWSRPTVATRWISMRCARKLTPRTKVVFFCSPHNPGGTVWSVEEIRALAAFCAEHDLILVSDEIHCDLVFDGAKHTPDNRRRARDRGPPDHLRRRHQDLQSRRRPCRRVRHLECGVEAPPRRADRGERSWLLQQLRHDRDRGGLADRRGVARRAAALPRREPRSLRRADRGGGARRPLDAARRHLSGVGRFFRNRPAARRRRRQGQEPRAHLRQPRLSSSGRAARPGCASTSPRRARSSRRRSGGWRTRFADLRAGQSERPGNEEDPWSA